jgi:FAD/FMN-containing dehydrogenase/ferredoxin
MAAAASAARGGTPDHVIDDLLAALAGAGFRGEAHADFASRSAASTDNSVYQILPDAVIVPRDADDTALLMTVMARPQFASLAVTARGGGTGTNGQALNGGVIVDFRRFMHRILAIDAAAGWVDVEPGIVLDDLNQQIAHTGLFFSPNTSTSNRCTVGGMASTDASGKGSRVYGKTADNVLGLELVLASGQRLDSGALPPVWALPILEQIAVACDAGRGPLLAQVPRLSRRFSGLDLERARPDRETLEWWRLVIGAEGTLGLVTRLRLRLVSKPAKSLLCVIAFDTFARVLDATGALLESQPLAIEVMDEWVQRLAREAGLLDNLPPALRGDIGRAPVYAFVEFVGDDMSELRRQMAACMEIAARLPGYLLSHATEDTREIAHLWSVRAASVGLLGGSESRRKPVSFVEDCVVPPEKLASFVADFTAILTRHGLNFGMYGHADVGCLHIRPALDMDDPDDRQRYKAISDSVFEAATRHGGIFWGEHGKGIRGDYLETFVGPEAFAAFRAIKAAFDPHNRLNPGKLMAERSTRYTVAGSPLRTAHAPANDPFEKSYACNGNALCLNYAARTPMCPSFKVSAELRHSPKGRAEALRGLRQAQQAGTATPAMEHDVYEAMSGCLGCRSCSSQCPAHVDIPEMKSHFLADYHARHARPLADHAILWMERLSALGDRFRPLARMFAALPVYRWVGLALGLVDLPKISKSATALGVRPAKVVGPASKKSRPVILVQDPFTNLFDGQAVADVARGLAALGYEPSALAMRPAGKAAHVKGDHPGFQRQARRLRAHLHEAAAGGVPLIGVDPAFIYMLRSEYPKGRLHRPSRGAFGRGVPAA